MAQTDEKFNRALIEDQCLHSLLFRTHDDFECREWFSTTLFSFFVLEVANGKDYVKHTAQKPQNHYKNLEGLNT